MTSSQLTETVLTEAATAVAEVFGLGDQAEVGKSWLVDDGDTVIIAEVAGDASGELVLAVNDEVGRRLASDASRLAAGLGRALAVLAEALGGELTLGAVVTDAAMARPEPTHRVEIRDGGKLCALLGVTLSTPDVEADTDEELPAGSVSAEPFTPAQFGDPRGDTAGTDGSDRLRAGLGPLALLQDIDMEVTVELGRTTMPIRDLLALQPGMVVEIDRVAGAPIDVLVNGHRFACGEVVVIDEEFGLRITEIVGAS